MTSIPRVIIAPAVAKECFEIKRKFWKNCARVRKKKKIEVKANSDGVNRES
jgi:hypothetical protein